MHDTVYIHATVYILYMTLYILKERMWILTLSRKHWKNHFIVYRLVNTSWVSCIVHTHTHQEHIEVFFLHLFPVHDCTCSIRHTVWPNDLTPGRW